MAMTPGTSASIQRCDMVSLATTNRAPGFSLYLRNGHDVSKLGAPKKSRQSAEGHFARIEQRRFWCDMVAFHLRDVSQHIRGFLCALGSPLSASQFRLVRHVSWKIVMYGALIR